LTDFTDKTHCNDKTQQYYAKTSPIDNTRYYDKPSPPQQAEPNREDPTSQQPYDRHITTTIHQVIQHSHPAGLPKECLCIAVSVVAVLVALISSCVLVVCIKPRA